MKWEDPRTKDKLNQDCLTIAGTNYEGDLGKVDVPMLSLAMASRSIKEPLGSHGVEGQCQVDGF